MSARFRAMRRRHFAIDFAMIDADAIIATISPHAMIRCRRHYCLFSLPPPCRRHFTLSFSLFYHSIFFISRLILRFFFTPLFRHFLRLLSRLIIFASPPLDFLRRRAPLRDARCASAEQAFSALPLLTAFAAALCC
jgi:hypothetical protein